MDGERFDAIARSLGANLSRRGALRRGGGLAAALLAGLGVRQGSGAVPRRQDGQDWYVVIRRYQPAATVDQLRQALAEGYAPLLRQQPGFVEYSVLASGAEVSSITVFASQAEEEAAAQQLADWIQQNLADLLPAPEETISGVAFVHAADPAAFGTTCPAAPTPETQPTAAAPTPESQPTAAVTPADPPTPAPTALPVCTDPSRPGVGCACTTGTQNPCGDTTLVCCKNDPDGPPGSPGTCTPASIGCEPLGPPTATPTAAPTALPICTDPDEPGRGCPCQTGTQNPCGATTLLCCPDDPNGPPGGPGTCVPDRLGCDPTGPTPTPTPAPDPPCTRRGCRCNGGVQNNCDDGLVCCPDNPGLPGGPGRCVREDRCNPQDCTGEGCPCHSGVEGACDDGLICCADDPSLPGGPGRCEAESICHEHACQATTNPCPTSCAAGSYCEECCSGYCGDDDHCATPPCSGVGCDCIAGTEGACDDGLVCCQSQMGGGPIPGGHGLCATPDGCGDAGAAGVTTPAPADDGTTPDEPSAPAADETTAEPADTTAPADATDDTSDQEAPATNGADETATEDAEDGTTAPASDDTQVAEDLTGEAPPEDDTASDNTDDTDGSDDGAETTPESS